MLNAAATPADLMNASIALRIATTLRDAGFEVVKSSLWKGTIRVDVRGKKADAVTVADMLKKCGVGNARPLKSDTKGEWMVVGAFAA